MTELTVQLPESVFAALRKEPGEFASEMRIAAAVKWYELGMISQEKAAEIAVTSPPVADLRYLVSVNYC